jgi:hypothetical protein
MRIDHERFLLSFSLHMLCERIDGFLMSVEIRDNLAERCFTVAPGCSLSRATCAWMARG